MRVFNRLLAFVLALALLATGVILIVEVIAANTNHGPAIFDWHAMYRWGQRNTWQATSVEITCGIVALAGLLLLLPQLRRRRPNRFQVQVDSAATDAALTRSGVRNVVRGAVEKVEGVSSTRVSVSRNRIKVNATASARTPEVARAVKPAVTEAANGVVESLRLAKPQRVAVSVTDSKGGAT